MRKTVKTIQEKEAIIAEYLLGEMTYRKLAEKHNVDYRIIHSWVRKFQGKMMRREKPQKVNKQPEQTDQTDQLSTDVKQLQEELRKAKLHNKLLNAIIDIAEDQLNIDIRKKSGTKQ
jgi:transposase-like protein